MGARFSCHYPNLGQKPHQSPRGRQTQKVILIRHSTCERLMLFYPLERDQTPS